MSLSKSRRNGLSVEEIRSHYFGSELIGESSSKKHDRSYLAGAMVGLTASSRYVANKAKKQLGEKVAFDESPIPDEEELRRLIEHVEVAEGEELSEREREAVVAVLHASLEHYDILSSLIENPNINDIIVRAFDDISIQIGRKNIQTDLKFADRDAYKSFVENLLKRAGKACTLATPVVDAAVDPYVRACVTHESFSPLDSGPMLTLRIARHSNTSIESLVYHELAPRPVLEYLAALVRSGDMTILIAGEVGTGKTTLVKALAREIDRDDALLIIEDTHELALQRKFTRTLLTREANTEGAGRISPAKAIHTGMRMAMNRIILGEMRDAETAEAFIDVCSSGHPGMSTIHARSARDALARLELFLLRAQAGVGVPTVRRQISNAISAIAFLDLDPTFRKRRIIDVLEVGNSADGAIQLSPIFTYNPKSELPEWSRQSGISFYEAQLRQQGVRLASPGSLLSFNPEQIYENIQQ